jgi:hypothetical protein
MSTRSTSRSKHGRNAVRHSESSSLSSETNGPQKFRETERTNYWKGQFRRMINALETGLRLTEVPTGKKFQKIRANELLKTRKDEPKQSFGERDSGEMTYDHNDWGGP